jgi:hypothetical protein
MNFESHVPFAYQCAPVTVANSTENSVLQELQFQDVSVRRILAGGRSNRGTVGGGVFSAVRPEAI